MTKKISNKDKQDWEDFLKDKKKVHNKDISFSKKVRREKIRKIDLHGYSLEDANKAIEHFINECYDSDVTKIIVITGKGLRSKNINNPYLSRDLGILKYSVPEFIENNYLIKKMIIKVADARIEDGGSGSFYIFLKNKLKLK